MGSVLLPLAMLIAFLPLVSAVHEAGHVIGGGLGGYYVAATGFGGGRRFWTVALSPRLNLFFGPNPFAGGATVAFPTRLPMGRGAAFSYHYGGIAAQLALQVVLHAVYWLAPELRSLLLPGMLLNAGVLATNTVPFRLPVGELVLASDGARVLEALGSRAARAVGPQASLGSPQFSAIGARIGTDVGRFVLGVCRARSVEDENSRRFMEQQTPPAGTPELYVQTFEELQNNVR
jgi:hypothetical protein